MSTHLAASPQAYRESAVLTAPPERLVVMLYDGARRFLYQAAVTMRNGDIQTSHERLRRAEAIIDHLLSTLDMSQGEVAQQLESIYVFCQRLLAEGRIRQDAEKLDQVSRLLSELRDAWDQIASAPQTVSL
ncbi:flagellar export chaperone FliS [Conexibacter stalactiti]|uniref:Flagellar secretion chaperone FliS n=1 Tax=Conexibacter stalactiti TaxID=1940611 RepID=A0ABU4HUL8_9ACTN|nr:flagellar export chaperone FliS [Conexibacter stalactiti]MDW5597017.1 flagellar export chaperone FliS [Conexibacter stalactiti]MEC5037659.1 flagellar export chaperone FliS [Conexibacter stalactiti]